MIYAICGAMLVHGLLVCMILALDIYMAKRYYGQGYQRGRIEGRAEQ